MPSRHSGLSYGFLRVAWWILWRSMLIEFMLTAIPATLIFALALAGNPILAASSVPLILFFVFIALVIAMYGVSLRLFRNVIGRRLGGNELRIENTQDLRRDATKVWMRIYWLARFVWFLLMFAMQMIADSRIANFSFFFFYIILALVFGSYLGRSLKNGATLHLVADA